MNAQDEKTLGIEIGLSVICAVKKKEETWLIADIADICGCSPQLIYSIEVAALKKLRLQLIKNNFDDYV